MPDPTDPLGFLAYTRALSATTFGQPAQPTPTGGDWSAPGLDRIVETGSTILGAPKAGIDWLARQSARRLFGLEVPETATTGSMLREAVGLSPGPGVGDPAAQGYAGRLGGAALEFVTDIGTDPLVAAMAAKAPAIATRLAAPIERAVPALSRLTVPAIVPRVAGAGFTGTMAVGAVRGGQEAAETIQREGLTPLAAEQLFHTGAAGLGALAGGAHTLARLRERPVRAAETLPAEETITPTPAPPERWEGAVPPGFETPRPLGGFPFPETFFRPESEPFQVPVDVTGELVPPLPVLAMRRALEQRPIQVQGEVMPERPELAPLGLEEPPFEGSIVQPTRGLPAPPPALPEPPPLLAPPPPRQLPAPVDAMSAQTPGFEAWLQANGLTVDPGNRAGLIQQWLKEHPDATPEQRAAVRPGAGRGPVEPAYEEPAQAEPVGVERASQEGAALAREMVPEGAAEASLREHEGLLRRPGRAAVDAGYGGGIKQALGLEGMPQTPQMLATAVRRDADNPVYLEAVERHRKALAERKGLGEAAEPSGEVDTSFDPAAIEAGDTRFAVRRAAPGQRGLFVEDVPAAGPKPTKPEQQDLFRQVDMLAPTEARVTEGREREGPLFRQEAEAAERADAARPQRFATRELEVDEAVVARGEAREQARFDAEMEARQRGEPTRKRPTFEDVFPEPPTLTAGAVQAAFKGRAVHPLEDGGFEVRLANGARIRVQPDATIEVASGERSAQAASAAVATAAGVPLEQQVVVGAFKRIGRDGLIRLATGDAVPHETFHAAMELVSTAGERRSVYRKYAPEARKVAGDAWGPLTQPERELHAEEFAAEAFSNPAKAQHGLFPRIKAFFRRVVDALLGRDAEAVFKRIRSGEVWAREGAVGREATTAATDQRFATAPAAASQATPQAFNIPEETLLQKVDRFMADKFSRLRTTVRAVGEQGGRVAAGEAALSRIERFGGLVESRIEDANARLVDPLVRELGRSKASLEDLGDYMALLHKPTRDAVISQRTNGQVAEGSGWTAADATTRWAELEGKHGARDAQGHIPGLEPMAAYVRQMRDEQLQVLERGGLISAQQAQSWRATMGDDYVPLRTLEVEEGLGTGRGFEIRGKESKAATGRSSKADNPVVFMVQQLNRAIIRAEKNKTDQQFADFVQDNKLFEFDVEHERTELDPKGQVRKVRDALADQKDFHYKVNGEARRITITDPLLDRAMRNLSADETGRFVRAMGGLTRAYSALVTSYNPEFIFTNFTRDIQTAVANVSAEQGAKIAGSVVKNVPQAMRGMAASIYQPGSTSKWATLAKEFKEDGGAIGLYHLKDVAGLKTELERRVKTAGPGALNASRRAMRGVAQQVNNINKIVENGTRLALYGALRESGVARDRAAVAAKRVTINFEQKGELGTFFNSLWAFSNASIQGTKRLVQVAVLNRTGRRVAAGIFGVGVALDQYNRSVAKDSNNDGTNDWDDVPEYVKERNLVVMRPDGGPPLLFPLPWGFNVAVSMGRLASAVTTGGMKPAKAGAALAGALWNAFNPVGGESDVVQALAPTFLDPVVQHEMNRDFTGRPIVPEQYPGSAKKPDSELYFRSVPPMSRWLAQTFNVATGGDKRTPGFIDVSPETIDHYIGWVTGGLGRFAQNAMATGEALAKGETPELRRVPFVRRFAYEAPESATGIKYREALQELTDVQGRYRGYLQDRDRSGLQDMLREPGTRRLLDVYQLAQSIEGQIKKLRDLAADRPDQEERIRPQIEALQKAVLRRLAAIRERKAA